MAPYLCNYNGKVEELAEEVLKGIGGVGASISTPVFGQGCNLGLFIFLAQQRLLKIFNGSRRRNSAR
jgi:hypothetical protein